MCGHCALAALGTLQAGPSRIPSDTVDVVPAGVSGRNVRVGLHLLSALESVGWFTHLGEQIADSPDTPRTHDWDEWPGPEDEAIAALHVKHVQHPFLFL